MKGLIFKWSMCAQSPQSRPTLSDTMTAARQAPLSMGFSRQEYWSGFLTQGSNLHLLHWRRILNH